MTFREKYREWEWRHPGLSAVFMLIGVIFAFAIGFAYLALSAPVEEREYVWLIWVFSGLMGIGGLTACMAFLGEISSIGTSEDAEESAKFDRRREIEGRKAAS